MVEITLSGPGKNALSTEVMTAALDAIRAAGPSAALLFTGRGDAFSAGLNLKEVASLDATGLERFLGLLDDLVMAIWSHPGPTVAAVNGHAIAGGCVIALACDVRVLTSNPAARVGLNEVAIGLSFPPRVFKLARVRLGPRTERIVLLEAGVYPPERALALGLVDEIADDPVAVGRERLAKLAAHPREAFEAAKAGLNRGALDLAPEEVDRYREQVLPRWTRPELKRDLLAILGRT